MREQYAELAKTPGLPAHQLGQPVEDVLDDLETKLDAEYEVPYLAHAAMEPLNCVVDLRADGCEIWTGTQFQTGDQASAAAVAGLKPEQVKIHTMFLGGGFGRRANPHSDFVTEAVQVAKAIGKPVKLIWTREDDMHGGYYRPMWRDYLRGGVDEKGNVVAWGHTLVGQSIAAGTMFASALIKDGIDALSVEGAADLPYAIPNMLVDLHTPENVVPVLWWRSVGHSHTAFVVESFLDELAHAANRDPLELRRSMLGKSPRHLAVLELAAKKAGWGSPLPKGHGRGLAVHSSFGSFVAQVAEVVVDGADIKVTRVVCAVDCGRTVNPDTIRAQMEGAIAFGLSAALHSEITLKDGRVEQGNYDGYVVLRINEMPAVEVHIVPSDAPPSGIGEPATPPIAPAVGNAIFAATGKRLRRLPFQLPV
jgi:isoquinoline 1-oxidoreductase beta subunit